MIMLSVLHSCDMAGIGHLHCIVNASTAITAPAGTGLNPDDKGNVGSRLSLITV